MHESNLFIALASALAARGEDGEVTARELALAFATVVTEGLGQLTDEEMVAEFIRLRKGE